MGKSVSSNWIKGLSYLILFSGLWIMILPFLWMISSSFKTLEQVNEIPIRWIPTEFHFENYLEVFRVIPMAKFMGNTVFVSFIVTVVTLMICAMAAYAFARLEFRGRDALFFCYLATMMVPDQVTMIPNFIMMKYFGWIDSYYALTIPKFFSAFGVFMLRQFFLTIPRELEEAATIDGCSRARTFWSVVLPLAKPALVTLGIFTFLGEWNSFLWPLIVTNNVDLQTIQVGLRTFQGEFGTQWNLLMAGTVIAELPIIALYIFAQKYIIAGIATSGIKG
ncbi:sugar ABC transporter permease [Paenibacillus herberti]|uniref:Sugar ABC transporter permease n=2 Tax=Paenibacillus herberti TaxID=1619309 RepID=A0A229NYL9_9BACL|nr:sugar ABC transporter permease [Paenibacillus herberti]